MNNYLTLAKTLFSTDAEFNQWLNDGTFIPQPERTKEMQSVFTPEEKQTIRELYAQGHHTCRSLSEEYHCSPSMIGRVVQGIKKPKKNEFNAPATEKKPNAPKHKKPINKKVLPLTMSPCFDPQEPLSLRGLLQQLRNTIDLIEHRLDNI